mmetsp:Transcript_23314/g.53957  ORF Transcript_23314/g.53957 Transcript_23314/m.53957 type:complete len:231 (+) Transcript_23314:16-708(+)
MVVWDFASTGVMALRRQLWLPTIIHAGLALVRCSFLEEAACPHGNALMQGLFTELRGFGEDGTETCVPNLPAQFLSNMTRALDLMSGRLQTDYLLGLRAGFSLLTRSLASVQSDGAECQQDRDAWEAFAATLKEMTELVRAGRLNSGFCPFTGKQQTTLGGAEVSGLLRRLASMGPHEVFEDGKQARKMGRVIGKLLRKVRKDGNEPDPVGAAPVNWEMRAAMFGDRLEL